MAQEVDSNFYNITFTKTENVTNEVYNIKWSISNLPEAFSKNNELKSSIFPEENKDSFRWQLTLCADSDERVLMLLYLDPVSCCVGSIEDVSFRIPYTSSCYSSCEPAVGKRACSANYLKRNFKRAIRFSIDRGYYKKNIVKCEFNCEVIIKMKFPLLKVSDVLQNFKSMLNSPKFSDVILEIEEKKIRAHKNILSARSSVFCAMFESNMKESEESVVNIIDIPYDIFYETMTFIYSGTIASDPTYSLLIHLVPVADKYDVHGLMQYCQVGLTNFLDENNVIEVLKLADCHNVTELKSKALDFIASNSIVVIETPPFKKLKTPQTALCMDIIQAMALKK